MRYFIRPYKPFSKGARALAKALKGRRIRDDSFMAQPGDVVINWGDGAWNIPRVPHLGVSMFSVLNDPVDVRLIANKRDAFVLFAEAEVPIPCFSVTKQVPWEGDTVVRHKLTGHSGEGIEIVKAGDTLPDAPLYVEYIKKEDEYRVHIGTRTQTASSSNGGAETSIIAVQRKARRLDATEVNWQVRNHSNGFVYIRGDVDPPSCVIHAATRAIVASGLDFGAVDVIYNRKADRAYVLEINTAPGLEGTTVDDYAAFFKEQ